LVPYVFSLDQAIFQFLDYDDDCLRYFINNCTYKYSKRRIETIIQVQFQEYSLWCWIICDSLWDILCWEFNNKVDFQLCPTQIENVYATKNQADAILIGLALLFWIGPSEEIFWRAFAQNMLSKKWAQCVLLLLILAFILLYIYGVLIYTDSCCSCCGNRMGLAFYEISLWFDDCDFACHLGLFCICYNSFCLIRLN